MRKYHDVDSKELRALSKAGHGRVEGGVCGAIHAAYLASDCPEYHNELNEYFETHAGSIRCREIRKAKKISCKKCVEIAAELAEKQLEKEKSGLVVNKKND